MRKSTSGFTILELLIVIVVIAILAAISIVAYRGIQERAQNAKTLEAVRQWANALSLYRADKGTYPANASCLGTSYGKGFSGNESTGGECRQDSAGAGSISVNATFLSDMNPYMNGNNPTPTLTMAGSASYPWSRGASYYAVSGAERIDFNLAGSSTDCPSSVGSLIFNTRAVFTATNSVRCAMKLPQ